MVVVALSADALLSTWDRAADVDDLTRALLLRATAEPGDPASLDGLVDTYADEPIGTRDRVLVEVLGATFGWTAECAFDCPSCGATGEFPLDLAGLVAGDDAAHAGDDPPGRPTPASGGDEPEAWAVQAGDWTVSFRLPTSRDLLDLPDDSPVDDHLRDRVLVAARGPDDGGVPASVWAVVEEAMATLDPLGDLRLATGCPTCGDDVDLVFDPAGFLWRRVDLAVRSLLAEVDLLARVYGWSEGDVLALAPARRRHYLDRVRA